MQYDFDKVVDRSSNHAAKYDERKKKFGTEDVIPLWVADMDLRTAQPIIDALKARAEEGIWGYTTRPDSYFQAIRDWQKRRNGWENRSIADELFAGSGPDHQRLRAAVHAGGRQCADPDACVLGVL